MNHRSAVSIVLAATALLAAGCGSVVQGTPAADPATAESVAKVKVRPETLLLANGELPLDFPARRAPVKTSLLGGWGPLAGGQPEQCALPSLISPDPPENNFVSAMFNTERYAEQAQIAIDTGQENASGPINVMETFAKRCHNYRTRQSGRDVTAEMTKLAAGSVPQADHVLLVRLSFYEDGPTNVQIWCRAYAVVRGVLIAVMTTEGSRQASTPADSAQSQNRAMGLLKDQAAKVARLV